MKKLKAFSLLEINFVFIILGISIAGILSLCRIIQINQKKYIDQKKYEYIKQSIQNYVIQHGRLPFASNDINGESQNYLRVGYLPYKSLGIDKSYLYDANHNLFQYEVNSYLASTNIPIIMPLTYHPKDGETSFNRIYETKDNKIIFYDIIAHVDDDISIIENNSNVIAENDYFYILNPMPKFNNLNELYKWYNDSQNKDDKFKCKNTIAWALSINKKYVYYQTRFDVSAQIGFYASPEPIYTA